MTITTANFQVCTETSRSLTDDRSNVREIQTLEQLAAAKEEIAVRRGELQDEMFEQIEDLIVRVANLEQIAKDAQSSKVRLNRRERDEKFKREAAARETKAAGRARDRCTEEGSGDPARYHLYLKAELEKTG